MSTDSLSSKPLCGHYQKLGDVWFQNYSNAPGQACPRCEIERMRAALKHIGEQASEGVFTAHGDCPATYACSAIIAELIDMGMQPKGVQPDEDKV